MRKMPILNSAAVGRIGEEIACNYLKKLGFTIQNRNIRKFRAEIDIIAKKDSIIHFIEVKSVSCQISSLVGFGHRPEDNVHDLKLRHIRRVVQSYISDQSIDMSTEFKFHVICVYIDPEKRQARIHWIRDIVL